MKTVSELAATAGVSVRTLHHYDEIGLLVPGSRTDAGYRLYSDADARRLHEILVWRSFGFPLDEVRALLDDPARDPLEALRLHRERLVAEVGALSQRLLALDAAIGRLGAGEALSDADLAALFDGFDPAAHAEEVEQRWGDTEAFRESKRRTARYGQREWQAIKDEAQRVNSRLGELCRTRTPVDAPEVRAAVEAHRAHLDRWFYPVSPEHHVELGRMYVDDPRFAATYDAVEPGLARWLRDAIESAHAPRGRRL